MVHPKESIIHLPVDYLVGNKSHHLACSENVHTGLRTYSKNGNISARKESVPYVSLDHQGHLEYPSIVVRGNTL